jgi:hypothetical protein
MNFGRGVFDWVIVATACVLLVFFFPVTHSSFTAMNGPVTALRAMRNSWLVQTAIALAASVLFSYSTQTLATVADVLSGTEWCSGRDLLKRSSILRC